MEWVSYSLAALALLLAVGTLAWQTPGIGFFGSLGGYLPGWLIVIAAGGTVSGVVAWILHFDAWIVAAVVASVLAALAGVKVITDQSRALRAVGLEPGAKDFFGPFLRRGKPADEIITYGPVDGHEPRMAVFRPAAGESPAPVVVHIHGGGWAAGSEVSDASFCRYLADQGFLVFAPTYTFATADAPTWELAPRQVEAAITFAHGLTPEYGGSDTGVYLTGSSAGGQLATLVANRATGRVRFDASAPFPRILGVAANIPAVDPGFAEGNPFAISGPAGRKLVTAYLGGAPESVPERLAASNSINFITPDAPPTLLVFGETDWLVPSQAIYTYAQRARELKAEVSTFGVPWNGHLIGLSGAGGRAIAELTVRWFRAHAPIGSTQ